MKKIVIFMIAVMMVNLVGCSSDSGLSDVEKARKELRMDEYESVIESMTNLVEEDNLNVEAWDLVAESLIKNEQYDQANDWLEDYLDVVDDNIDNKDFDLVKAVDSIGDYGRDLLREGEKVGDWYDQLIPASVDVDQLDWSYDLGTELTFDVPEGGTLLYTLNGESPKTDGLVYKNGITLDESGYIDLKLVVTNRYQEYSAIKVAYLDVYDMSGSIDTDFDTDDDSTDGGLVSNENLETPVLELESGSYEGPVEVTLLNYTGEEENISVTYTTDGTDPTSYEGNYEYYWGSIFLGAGEHSIALVAYDYNSDTYSDVAYYEFDVNIEGSIKVGLYDIPYNAQGAFTSLFNDAVYYDIFIEPVFYNDLNEIDINDLPDAVITLGEHAGDLSSYGIVADVDQYFNLADYNYINNAPELGSYNGVHYMLPISIRQEFLVYGDYESAGLINWEYLKGESDWYSKKFMYPTDSGQAFLGIYYGLGGEVIGDSLNLNRDKVVEALTLIKGMPEEGLTDELYTQGDLLVSAVGYDVENYLMDDTVEYEPENYYSYQVGGMPLPNGDSARYYNEATGLYLSSFSIMSDPDLVDKIQKFYDYMMYESYSTAYAVQLMGGMPAIRELASTMEYYSMIPYEDYLTLLDNGISEIPSPQVKALYNSLKGPLTSLAEGANVEEVADMIMDLQ